jgi:hypothetical protein
MNYIVYQAHSHPTLYYETVYSVYSCLLNNNDLDDIEFIIYTDNIIFFNHYFSHLKINYEYIPSSLLAEWKGEFNFIHRLKIKMLQDALTKYRGNFIYVDSDTYFVSSTTKVFADISQGTLFMHCYEKNLDRSRIYKPLLNYKTIFSDTEIMFTNKIQIWNAGAIGMNNESNVLLAKILLLTDHLYKYYQRHIIEQFAFSYIFQQIAIIQPLDKEIYHYWFLKEFRDYLSIIFNNPLSAKRENLEVLVKTINPCTLAQAKLEWKKSGGLYRGIQRMFGKKYKLKPLENIEDIINSRANAIN